MTWLKDLLYARGNVALDIARLSSACAVVVFLSLSIADFVFNHRFNFAEFGTGWGLTAAGSAGWIFARQAKEGGGGNVAD